MKIYSKNRYYNCTYDGCDYISKRYNHLQNHIKYKHDNTSSKFNIKIK